MLEFNVDEHCNPFFSHFMNPKIPKKIKNYSILFQHSYNFQDLNGIYNSTLIFDATSSNFLIIACYAFLNEENLFNFYF